MRKVRYDTVHEDLLAALPELATPYARLAQDWDNFGGEPPGQYIVFSNLYGRMLEITLTLSDATPGREELLRRAIDFGEAMLSVDDYTVRSLGIDAAAETLDGHPAGRDVVSRLGGEALRAWFADYSSDDWTRPAGDDIIDLWGGGPGSKRRSGDVRGLRDNPPLRCRTRKSGRGERGDAR